MAANNPNTGYIQRKDFGKTAATTSLLLKTDGQFQRVTPPRSQETKEDYHVNSSKPYSQPMFVQGEANSIHAQSDVICPVCRQQIRDLSNISHSNYQPSGYPIRQQNLARQLIEENQEPSDVNPIATPFSTIINPPAADVNPPTTSLMETPIQETQPGLEHSELVCGRFSLTLPHSVALSNN